MINKLLTIFTLLVATLMLHVGVHATTDSEMTIVSCAQKYLNAPYKYEGTTPEGFDTSGFVQYVFKQSLGIRLPRTVQLQYKEGIAVDQDFNPSDLLFFTPNGKLQSVGIYVGNDTFITVTRQGVKVQNLNIPYWKKHYYGAKRVSLPSSNKEQLIKDINTFHAFTAFTLFSKKEDIETKWGKPSGVENGFSMYPTQHVGFQYFDDSNDYSRNYMDQVSMICWSHPSIKDIHLNDVKKVLGEPTNKIKNNFLELHYLEQGDAGTIFRFPLPTKINPNPILHEVHWAYFY